jgi:hypothetical protein
LVGVGDGARVLVGVAVGVLQPTDADAVAGKARQAMDRATIAVVVLMAPPDLALTEQTLGTRQQRGECRLVCLLTPIRQRPLHLDLALLGVVLRARSSRVFVS